MRIFWFFVLPIVGFVFAVVSVALTMIKGVKEP